MTGQYTSFAIVQEAGRARRTTLRTHRLAIGLYDRRDGKLVRTERVELDVAARAPRCRSWSACRSRTCCWSTTTT